MSFPGSRKPVQELRPFRGVGFIFDRQVHRPEDVVQLLRALPRQLGERLHQVNHAGGPEGQPVQEHCRLDGLLSHPVPLQRPLRVGQCP